MTKVVERTIDGWHEAEASFSSLEEAAAWTQLKKKNLTYMSDVGIVRRPLH